MELLIVTGLSGAGKSVALNTLEDLGYYCIDNLPVFLLRDLALGLAKQSDRGDYLGTAVGIDARNQPLDLAHLPQLIDEISQHEVTCRVLFLEAQTETLIKRFSETRRKHPLTRQDRSLAEAIGQERELLQPLYEAAEYRVDTTHTNVHELRELLGSDLGRGTASRASILLQSFGFKHGVPEGVDFIFDVRCLPNPHWQTSLRPLTGLDVPVVEFLESAPEVGEMRRDLIAFFERWVPRFQTDGRSYLTIAIGCTGGQHRSVYMVDALRRHFSDKGYKVMVRHRELQ